MTFHQRLRRLIAQQSRLLPSGGQLVTLRWRNEHFYRLTVVPPRARYVYDAVACQYFDRPHPLSDILYERPTK
jgi:hypothetical protein